MGKNKLPLVTSAILLAAALFLSIIDSWPVFPWLAGVVVAIVLNLVGLRKLLGFWAFPAALAVVVVWLAVTSSAWAWLICLGLGLVSFALLARTPIPIDRGLERQLRVALVIVGAAVIAAGGIGLSVHNYQQTVASQGNAQQQQQQNLDRILPHSPGDALSALYAMIGRGDALQACVLFSDQGKQEFSSAAGAADCTQAVQVLHDKVIDPATYGDLSLPAENTTMGNPATADGCAVSWQGPFGGKDPGPHLGKLILQQNAGGAYLITGYQACSW